MFGRARIGTVGAAIGWLTLLCSCAAAADAWPPQPRVMNGAGDVVWSIALFDDGRRVAASGKGGTIHVWDTVTGQELQKLEGHTHEVHTLVVSRDGSVMASTAFDATVRIWDLKTLKPIRSFTLPENGLQATFSPDHKQLLVSTQASRVLMLDAQTGEVSQDFGGAGYVAKLTPDGREVVTATRGEVRCLAPETKERLWTASGAGWHPSYLIFTPDSSLALLGMNEAGVLVLDMKDGHEVRWQTFHGETARGMGVAPDGKWALTGTTQGNIYQWDIATGHEMAKYTGHTLDARTIDVSPDGRMFVSGGNDGTVRTWRVGTTEGAKPEPGVATVDPAAPPGERTASGSDSPATKPAPSPAGAAVAAAPRPQDDPIERPQYRNRAKQIEKDLTSITSMMVRINDDGSAMGFATDIIATASGDTRRVHDGSTRILGKVGDEMKISEEEALRAVKMRYPVWIGGDITFSFGEKYTPHDGGSAGTAFGVMLLSTLEGIELDPKCAITGDITVDWKVRKVGAVAAKLRGATVDGCLYAAIPEENATAVSDMYLLWGDSALWDIQTLTIGTMQDAVAVVRKDRAPALAEALRLFAGLQPHFKKSGRAALRDAATLSTLHRVHELAPNHLSAKLLLEIAENRAATTLSVGASLYELSVICYPYRDVLNGRARIGRFSIPALLTVNTRRHLQKLRPVMNKEFLPALADLSGFTERADWVSNHGTGEAEVYAKRDQFFQHLAALAEDRTMLERLVREGY